MSLKIVIFHSMFISIKFILYFGAVSLNLEAKLQVAVNSKQNSKKYNYKIGDLVCFVLSQVF